MKLIAFAGEHQLTVFVNPKHITFLQQAHVVQGDMTYINFVGGTFVPVQGPIHQIEHELHVFTRKQEEE
jgi:hypothetical protein